MMNKSSTTILLPLDNGLISVLIEIVVTDREILGKIKYYQNDVWKWKNIFDFN
jgi:hypothetical protein